MIPKYDMAVNENDTPKSQLVYPARKRTGAVSEEVSGPSRRRLGSHARDKVVVEQGKLKLKYK